MNIIESDYQAVKFVMSSYDKDEKGGYLKSGDPVRMRLQNGDEKIIGYVDYVNDNKLTGEWTATVLPIQIDYSLPEEEIQKIRAEQSIVYVHSKGSEGPNLLNITTYPVVVDWLVNNANLGSQIVLDKVLNTFGLENLPGITIQATSTVFTVNHLFDVYPNAGFVYGGHSQGDINLQYVLAFSKDPNRVIAAFLAEGPNVFGRLDSDARARVRQIADRIFLYVDPKDMIAFDYDDPNRVIGQLYKIDSKFANGADQHMTGGYQYDSKGNLLFLDIESAARHRINLAKFHLVLMQNELNGYFKDYNGISKDIYIEYRTIEAILNSLDLTVYNEITAFKGNIKQAINMLEQNWDENLNKAKQLAPNLSISEILDELASQGVTEETMVGATRLEFENKTTNIDYIYQEFLSLVKQVKSGIEEIKELDVLASELFLQD